MGKRESKRFAIHRLPGMDRNNGYQRLPFCSQALEFIQTHVVGKNRSKCHDLCVATEAEISALTGMDLLHPNSPSFIAQMAANSLPSKTDITLLKTTLYDRYKIEIPTVLWQQHKLIRASFQIYNDENDAQMLVDALKKCL
jgi:selenocysteine lyase/cysteine desulfurase